MRRKELGPKCLLRKFGDVTDNYLCWIGRAGVPAGRGSMTGTEAGPTGKGRYPTYQNT